MLFNIITYLVGSKFDGRDEQKKIGLLGFIYFFIISVYWGFRPIKDSIFSTMVGYDYQPWAKILSLGLIVPLMVLYSKLIDIYPRHRVFYGVTIFYGLSALLLGWLLSDPVYGPLNKHDDPTRILGWIWYVFVESYGSLLIALFWAFTTDITKPEMAKRGFPFIVLFGQVGNVLGPYLFTARRFGFMTSAPIIAIGGLVTLFITLFLIIFMRVIPASQLCGYEHVQNPEEEKDIEEKIGIGFFEGLKLLLTKGYLLGIFLIMFSYGTIISIFDFFFKSSAQLIYRDEVQLAAFLSKYSVYVGIASILCLIFRINKIQHYLDIRWSLTLLPVLVAGAVITIWLYPNLEVVFWIMVAAKAVNYALNAPTIRQLYIPTSKEVKYKSQAWIDIFGSRGSKATGSAINMSRIIFKSHYGPLVGSAIFLQITSAFALGLIGFWIVIALYVAKKYNHAIKEKKVVC